MTWHDEWEKEMGEPLGKAVKNGYVYTRDYKYCKVSLDVENVTSSIIWGSTVPRGENIALNGAATQSSTDGGVASLAIDGNTDGALANGSVAQTTSESDAWWQVDLGSSYSIGEISIYTITDTTDVDDFADFTVYVLDENNDTTYARYYENAPDTIFLFDADGAMGTTIKIQSHTTAALSLAEVEVFEYQYAIDFVVTDSTSSQSLEDVSFTINGNDYITSSTGETTAYLNEGLQNVVITKAGYETKTISVNLPADTLVAVELVKEGYDLTFSVKDKDTGLSLTGATVSIADTIYTANDNGSILINLAEGTYSYTVSQSGYDDKTDMIEVSNDTTISVLLSALLTDVESIINNSINIYPNPVEDVLYISSSEITECSYNIISPLGQTVKSGTLKQNNNTIDLKELKSGIYNIIIYNDRIEIMNAKILKR
jgi:hypothetical protein